MAMQVGASSSPYIPQLRRGMQIVMPIVGSPVPLAITPSAPPPTPGSVGIGELSIDAQSRTMWLGVAAEVDLNQALLVADIAACFDNDVQVLADAKTYTNEQIQTRAPTLHKHVAADITDFATEVNNVVKLGSSGLIVGMIMMWKGNLTDVGVGQLADWWPCDGTHGTINLKDRFVIGAGGTRPPTTVNDPVAGALNTGLAGAHTPICHAFDLQIVNMPAHKHVLNDDGHLHGITDNGHSHPVPQGGGSGTAGPGFTGTFAATGTQTATSRTTGISIKSANAGITMDNTGGGVAHAHTMTAVPDHVHSLPAVTNQLPWYALCFIQKIS